MDPNKKPPLIVDGVHFPVTVNRSADGDGHYLTLGQKDPDLPDIDLIYVEEASIPQLEDAIAKVKAEIQAAKGGDGQ